MDRLTPSRGKLLLSLALNQAQKKTEKVKNAHRISPKRRRLDPDFEPTSESNSCDTSESDDTVHKICGK